jgi:uncharacterized 2Fe-2S/4Fe-4S cluster protein (DUF4445 family)
VASCGGKGVCGKCRVKIIEGSSRIEATGKLTKKEREENMVLACQAFPEENVVIEVPEDAKLVIGDKIAVSKSKDLLGFLRSEEPAFTPPVKCTVLNLAPPTIHDNISDLERIKRALDEKGIHGMRFSHDFVSSMSKALRDADWKVTLAYTDNLEAFALSPAECLNEYGIAVDIGTTTVVLYLINCYDGSLVDVGMTYNSQMRYGDDVITRIVHATEGGGIVELQNAVVDDINDMLLPILEKNGINRDAIVAAVLSGNTTMSQLLGIGPVFYQEEPYIPTINIFPMEGWHRKGKDKFPGSCVYAAFCRELCGRGHRGRGTGIQDAQEPGDSPFYGYRHKRGDSCR